MKEWIADRGWTENPFNFKIYPDLLVGYQEEINRISDAISADNKFSVVVGRTGAGKTNLLKWIAANCSESRNVHYMPKPPTDNEDLLDYLIDEVLQSGFFARFTHSYTLYNIHDELQDELREPTLLVIDECHEASLDVLQWVRTAIDHVDNLSVLAAGLPEFEETLREEVNTLYSRATHVESLESLDRDETVELIRKRIEQVGGASVEPFTQSAAITIYERTDGFPREVLRACNRCVMEAAREGLTILDEEDVERILVEQEEDRQDESSEEANSPGDEEIDINLTSKQREVLEVVREEGGCTSGDVVDRLGTEDYTSRSHAVRSVNNILKRLMENDVVVREREGRSYKYYLED
jgi:type II secretory pathway predicted ATPase ExeA